MILTKQQRQALKRVWERHVKGKLTYRDFRKEVQGTICMDSCVMVPAAGMWIGIETDGYTHT